MRVSNSEKTRKAYAYLNQKMPDEPEYSEVANQIIEAFYVLVRGRRYEQRVMLPLSLHDLAVYCDSYDIGVTRQEFDAAIFALDNLYLELEAGKR